MRVIKTEKVNGNYKLIIPSTTSITAEQSYCFDAEAIKQCLENKLQIVKGEYYLNTTLGIPLAKNKDVIDLAIQEIVLATDGVEKILSFKSSFDYTLRAYSATLEISTIYNTNVKIEI